MHTGLRSETFLFKNERVPPKLLQTAEFLSFSWLNNIPWQTWGYYAAGRTDAKAEAPILWPPNVKTWLIWKDPDAGKDWGQEKGMIEHEMVGWHHQFDRWVWLSSGSWWWTGQPGVLQSMGLQRVGHDLAAEQQQQNQSDRGKQVLHNIHLFVESEKAYSYKQNAGSPAHGFVTT